MPAIASVPLPFPRALALLAASALLSGCASLLGTPPSEPASDAQLAAWESHEQSLESMSDWAFDGRAAVRSGVTGGSVQLEWTQVGTVTSLELAGPFDTGRLAMTGTADHMLLTDGNGNRRVTDRPEALLEEQTGWRIPLSTLPRWVRGLPSDSLEALESDEYRLDDQGRLLSFTDEGWEVEYDRYREIGRFALPHFVELRHDGMRIRIAVHAWDVGQGRQ
ncbi:lipoprotein insertase outer membrane protein LolB [Guyparkeria hydrothermalis]|uniref:Outer-membrane lipoprotein LolB n=1 Tax=Guyparkeria halophila TaxID=47960 RepID=A0A6I6D4N2_9GAMM|nr:MULTISPECIES: lipoprotein insertase outer membrane protein LolB [Guyparkeria]MCL7751692.1 lipoprotein insertase outer membrane protein LolB [Guyparkeria hydrothermalis]QGT78504.1 outer membrane lipoprotein LolB [Guyparkeria halophila]TKA91197.1 outer membrane lipoprotein LolB [Guyparkeria sp. SB14A]